MPTLFDVKVIALQAETDARKGLTNAIRQAAQEKSRAYNDRIIRIDNGISRPLMFGSGGHIGPDADRFTKVLAVNIAKKRIGSKASDISALFRLKIAFTQQKCRLLSLRGIRSRDTN